MSKFTSKSRSFIHMFKKFGAKSAQKHDFLDIVYDTAVKYKDEWFIIDKELAECLVQIKQDKFQIGCSEVEDEKPPCFYYITADDLQENGHFPEHWKTFTIII